MASKKGIPLLLSVLLVFLGLLAARAVPADSPPSMKAEFEAFKAKRLGEFEEYKREFERFKAIAAEERARVVGKVAEVWEEPELSSEKVWVRYSDDLSEREKVDFASETITLEFMDPDSEVIEDRNRLRQRVTALLETTHAEAFAKDPVSSAVEERGRKELSLFETAEIPQTSVLLSFLTGLASSVEQGARSAGGIVSEIVSHMLERTERAAWTDGSGRTVTRLSMPLTVPASVQEQVRVLKSESVERTGEAGGNAPDELPARAAALWSHVRRNATESRVPRRLIYSIIEAESAFDPMATSHVPAYGLMQIVPESAGLDVTEKLFGEPRILAPSYLYIPENNVRVGATYMGILHQREFRRIRDPRSRVYCAIAAYNTGAGNVSRAFTGSTRLSGAIDAINSMPPEAVYEKLRAELPYDETRKYLQKVSGLMKKYERFGVDEAI